MLKTSFELLFVNRVLDDAAVEEAVDVVVVAVGN